MKCVVGGKGEEPPEAHTQGVEDLKSSFDPHLWQRMMQREGREERLAHRGAQRGKEVGREPVDRPRDAVVKGLASE